MLPACSAVRYVGAAAPVPEKQQEKDDEHKNFAIVTQAFEESHIITSHAFLNSIHTIPIHTNGLQDRPRDSDQALPNFLNNPALYVLCSGDYE